MRRPRASLDYYNDEDETDRFTVALADIVRRYSKGEFQ
jgi:selenocysteine lyase/cysteine desulfurase